MFIKDLLQFQYFNIYNELINKLLGIENELMMERKNYKDILNKYDLLQKEQIDAKSKMTAEKEKLQWYMNFNL